MSADTAPDRGEAVRTTALSGAAAGGGPLPTSADSVRTPTNNPPGGVRIEYRTRVPRQLLGAALTDAFAVIARETGQTDPPRPDMSGRGDVPPPPPRKDPPR